jgi:hypothetical protein
MQRLSSFAFLTALVSLSLAGGCKSDDAGGQTAPEQPGTAAAAAPGDEGDPGLDGERRGGRGGMRNMTPEERRAERLRKFDTATASWGETSARQ